LVIAFYLLAGLGKAFSDYMLG